MDARTRTLLEELAFGSGDDVRPADRLWAAEILATAEVVDSRVAAMAEVLNGMSEEDARGELDQLAAAHVIEAWHEPDRWPEIRKALDGILREAVSRETGAQEPDTAGRDGPSVVPLPEWSEGAREARAALSDDGWVSRLVARRPDEEEDGPRLPPGVDSILDVDVGWRPYGDG